MEAADLEAADIHGNSEYRFGILDGDAGVGRMAGAENLPALIPLCVGRQIREECQSIY